MDLDMDGRSGASKDESESAKEDGELPSLVIVAYGVNDVKVTPSRVSNFEHSKQLTLIAVNLCTTGESHEESYSKWYNQLRAMEAEVNLYLLKMLPLDQENYTLAHQVYCLAMLFDYITDDSSSPSAKSTSIVDIGLCKRVSGRLLSRAFRGRDRRKMLSWKDIGCTSGYPN